MLYFPESLGIRALGNRISMKKENTTSIKTNIFKILLVILGVVGLTYVYASNHTVVANDQEYTYSDMQVLALLKDINREPRQPKFLTIKKGDFVYGVVTKEVDIYDILSDYKISLEENEKIIISTQNVKNGSFVRIIETDIVVEDVHTEIPFDTRVVKTDKYIKGEEHISQEGVLGIRKQRVLNYYEDGVLVDSQILENTIERHPQTKVLEVGTAMYSLEGIDAKGYNCEYWHKVVDTGPYSEEEKVWLKFIMYCESGCNAESNKGNYKGLFQWSPFWWSKQYSENIFDGHAQIRHTVEKYRSGESTRASQWPACHAKFVREIRQ